MSPLRPRARRTLVLGALLWAVSYGTALAQFNVPGFSNLPDDDFTWRWGEQRGSRIEDFSIRATDTGFDCTLTGELRPGSRLSRIELRRIENELRSSLSFVAAATSTMNGLERRRDLDWAVLDCEKLDSDED